MPQPVASERNSNTVAPIPATTGLPGLFTVETAEAQPKGVFTASTYLNKFSRAPGSVTVLSSGLSMGAGLTASIPKILPSAPARP